MWWSKARRKEEFDRAIHHLGLAVGDSAQKFAFYYYWFRVFGFGVIFALWAAVQVVSHRLIQEGGQWRLDL